MNLFQNIPPPFKCLMPKELQSKNSTCEVCSVSLNILNRQQCHFCGFKVCSDHLVKNRQNPTDPSKWKGICANCETKYIHYKTCMKYQQEIDIHRKRVKEKKLGKFMMIEKVNSLVERL